MANYEIEEGRQVYFVQIEGKALLNDEVKLDFGDACEITKRKI